jgi:single-stranded DNA-binding protein
LNNLILAIAFKTDPEIKNTNNEKSYCQFTAEFQGKPDAPPLSARVTAWGNLALEVQQGYSKGDRAIIEGRVQIDKIEHPEGFKESRAAISISKIHSLGEVKAVETKAVAAIAEPPPPRETPPSDADLDLIPF